MSDRRLLGELLVEAGLVRRADLESALREQRLRGGRLCYHLMRLGKVTPASLFLFLQEHFGTIAPEFLEILRNGPIPDLIPARLAHFYQMVPLKREGDRLLLAIAYVDNPSLIPAVEELTGLKVDPVICPPGLIQESLVRFFRTEEEAGVVRGHGENLLVLADPSMDIAPPALNSIPESASPVIWLRGVIAEAIKRRCREILVEPHEEGARVVFRQREGGDVARVLPSSLQAGFGLVLEDLSRMATRGRTVPREGRFRMKHGDRLLSAQVTSLPSLAGDVYHLGILEERIRKESLEEMMEDYPDARSGLEAALASGRGLLLVAAPEGHFRDRILSALLQSARWPVGRSILLGDVGAAALPGIDSRALRGSRASVVQEAVSAALQERPDLLAVQKIQGVEEASALMEAGSRCLVIAGVARSDAFRALEWLVQVGLLESIRQGKLAGILGTRMVERVCDHCRRRFDLLEEFPNLIADPNPSALYFANAGCRACRGAGIVELEPAFEFLSGEAQFVSRLLTSASSTAGLGVASRLGVKSLYLSVLARAAAGEVDVREPLRLLLLSRDHG